MAFNRELEELEAKLKEVQAYSGMRDIVAEYNRLLALLGNVDGTNEMIALVLIAQRNANRLFA